MDQALPEGIDLTATPSGTGCLECSQGQGPGWWVHLRRCAQCGHVGCCDSSPSQHASKHAAEQHHPWMASFEPGEDWIYSYQTEQFFEGVQLAPPTSHPLEQPAPGPAGKVPADWQSHLN